MGLGFSNPVVLGGRSRPKFLGRHLHSFPPKILFSAILLYGSPQLTGYVMNYKGFTLHSVVPRPGSMVTLEKPSLIGGHHIQSIYAKKPQPVVSKDKKE